MKDLQRDFTYVQPIIVLQDEATHEGTVHVAALVSVDALTEETDTWREWLSSSHAKTVRRAKEKEFNKILLELEDSGLQWCYATTLGGAAVATEPMTYEAMPKSMRRAQVSGTEFPRTRIVEHLRAVPTKKDTPVVYLDASLGMSTGKEAAQVAHAYWACKEKGLELPWEIIPVDHASFGMLRPHARAVIVDNGLTEVPQATATVLVH